VLIEYHEEGNEWLFIEEFNKQHKDEYWYDDLATDRYKEKCYHYDSNNDIDWALISYSYIESPTLSYAVFDDMVYLSGGHYIPFDTGDVLYDFRYQKFVNLIELDNFSEYDGLKEELHRRGDFVTIGDFDRDNRLTVFDATGIQRAIAGVCEFHFEDDDLSQFSYKNLKDSNELSYITDFDRDGERTVLDATAIQRYIAGIE